MREGLNFVRGHRLLVTMAACVGVWQMCNQAAMVVQILFATRQLGLTERGVGLSYVALGVGTVVASAIGYRVVRGWARARRWCWALRSAAWDGCVLAVAPHQCASAWPPTRYMLFSFGVGAVFIFINFLSCANR